MFFLSKLSLVQRKEHICMSELVTAQNITGVKSLIEMKPKV